MYLSYLGIRVQDPRRSAEFYRDVFGLEPVEPFDWSAWTPSAAACLLLRDRVSGQRLELNYYPPGNPYAVRYQAGEELDHVAFRVDDLDEVLRRLAARGVAPEKMAHYEGPVSEGTTLRMAYVRDPDGIQLELFQSKSAASRPYSPDDY
jgi:catechol 2,3-dioxygenase-like lactoylglutathione lyase family enzyme